MIWGPSPNGLFSVKGAYKTQMQEVNPHPNTQLLNVLWNYRLFPLRSNCLVGFFCVANCQSDKDLAGSFPILLLNVHSVGVNLNLLILFMHCNFAQSVWNCIHGSIAHVLTVGDHIAWLSSLNTTDNQHGPNDFCKGFFICWQIWDARNNLIHLDYWKANHKLKKQKQVVPPIKWKPPPSGWIKLNFDGSIKNGVANTSFFIQNDNAHTLLPGAKNIGVNSITMAECLALRDGLAHANLLHEQSKIHELLDNLEWEASHS
ncbi:PREDICTED: reverse mRNAase [Prunus dulcis]|uniref:PREDICTED: reverse mRNAase n=1 Tax=Prunus dulcis TaxID=3755 RepID=A0A5E4GBK1_PRUDU|nr:PREDICTED: reverse mRNAase [Prunus dulcis]